MSNNSIKKQDALDYHSKGRPGKIEVISTKDTQSQRDLALAYSPGVAYPCEEIAANKEDVYKYTAKGNLVAVISNGTAVLGLGNIGPEASKPVMEGKGILFKIFADIDVFDIELDASDPDHFINVVKALEPTFGGINLEDIKAPDCFYIEERLKAEMKIPIMHDDQHGTAIITGAGLINALEVVGKNIEDVKLVVSGAGASALSCVRTFIQLGIRKENLILCDSKGAVTVRRTDLDKSKVEFASTTSANNLEEAIVGADVFLGLSKADVLLPEMLLSMAADPIVFALANPNPEIRYDLAMQTRPDILFATGRSDYPNQVNNVLGFPFIFRGALDVRATQINEAMKMAAVHAIAELAKLPVPEVVNTAYNQNNIVFGKNYIIPKPLDPRLLTTVAPAVAKAAIESGVAKNIITDWDAYKSQLSKRMGSDEQMMRVLSSKAQSDPRKVVIADAEDKRILRAAQIANDEGIAKPILLGNREEIFQIAADNNLDLKDIEIIDPTSEECIDLRKQFGDAFFAKRQRKGYNHFEAHKAMYDNQYFGNMMVAEGVADAFICGQNRKYSDAIRPALEAVGPYRPGKKIASMYMMLTKKGPIFFADTSLIPHPTAEEIVDITLLTANAVRLGFNTEPRVALLSYSNFGSSSDSEPSNIQKAVQILKKSHPKFVFDGEMQANFAFNTEMLKENFPFSELADGAPNVLIFPNLAAANISYKLLQVMSSAEAVGPIILGMRKSIHVLQMGSSVREILNMITIACVDAQYKVDVFNDEK